MNQRYKLPTFWPEIVAGLLLILYTIIRTIVVAHGISPVSQVSWQVFLAIEIVTTAPYVWGMGKIVRRAAQTRQLKSERQLKLATGVAVASLLAPYAYLAWYGALSSSQGAGIFLGLLVIFTLPSLVRLVIKLYRSRQA